MQAAYIEQTGPPEVIKVGDLPRPEPGPGQVLVRVHAVAAQPDRPLHPVGPGGDAAGLPLCHRLRPGRHGREARAEGGDEVTRWATVSGDRTRGCSGRQGVAAEYAAVDEDWLYPTPALLPDDRGRRDGPGRDHGAPRALPVRPAQGGRDGLCPRRRGRRRLDGRPDGQGGRGPRRDRRPAAPSSVELCRSLGADLALNYKTDDIPARLREFAPEGFDVWYETQREPNLEVSIPLLRKHGRMILMAGRTAKPALPLGAFYPRNCAIFGFAMFNATPGGAARVRRGHHPLDRGRPAQADRRPDLPAGRGRRRREVPGGQHPGRSRHA